MGVEGVVEVVGVMVGMDQKEMDHFIVKNLNKENPVTPANTCREKLQLCSHILMENNLQFMVTCPTCQLVKKRN